MTEAQIRASRSRERRRLIINNISSKQQKCCTGLCRSTVDVINNVQLPRTLRASSKQLSNVQTNKVPKIQLLPTSNVVVQGQVEELEPEEAGGASARRSRYIFVAPREIMNGIGCLQGVLLFLLSQIVVIEPGRQLHHHRMIRSDGTEDTESSQDSYVVGVVEFRPESSDIDIRRRTELHLEAYAVLIRSDEAKVADIIVFPELTLNTISDPVYVPHPSSDMVVPCSEGDSARDVLANLSCLAAEVGKYLVINLSEIFDCKSIPSEDPRPCGPHGFHRYNTNIVFDRNGAVIARYRKFNIMGENGTNRTYVPEMFCLHGRR